MLLRKLPIRRVIQTRALSALSSSSAPHAPNISPNPKPKPQPNANANANANLNPNPSAGSQKAPRGVGTFAVTVPLEPSSLSPDSLKEEALNRVRKCLAPKDQDDLRPGSLQTDGAVLLVSRAFAPWLDDKAFLSQMLVAAGLASEDPVSAAGETRELTMLAAAIDQVPRYYRELDYFGSSEGISVIRGSSKRLLSRVWDATPPPAKAQQASLQFIPPRAPSMPPMTVTLPLANTLFTTGKPHALFVSRWATAKGRSPELLETLEREQATIAPKTADRRAKGRALATSLRANLIPVTPPRKILASLGNILSRVEIDGRPAPASRELEDVVPRLIEQRRERLSSDHGEDHTPAGPIGVWALTIPEALVAARPPSKDKQYSDEPQSALARDYPWETLTEAGCQLNRVLSGGGGWGSKQGLLSLDPQTTLATDEHQDMQSFLDSFEAKASPEAFVQFFVEATIPAPTPSAEAGRRLQWDPSKLPDLATTVVGTAGSSPPGVSPQQGPAAEACPGLFGAVSEEGVYIEQGTGGRQPALTTKMDVPHSYVISHAPRLRDARARRSSPAGDSSSSGSRSSRPPREAAGFRLPWESESPRQG